MRLLLIAVLFFLIYLVLRGWGQSSRENEAESEARQNLEREREAGAGQVEDLVQDPFCGVFFPRSQGLPLKLDGRIMLFMNEECRDNYLQARQSGQKGRT